VTKPFSVGELVARIKRHLSPVASLGSLDESVSIGSVVV